MKCIEQVLQVISPSFVLLNTYSKSKLQGFFENVVQLVKDVLH